MASPYLNTRTEQLLAGQAVEPSQARAAQIPLQNFNLPTFPPEAFTSGLSLSISSSTRNLQPTSSNLRLKV